MTNTEFQLEKFRLIGFMNKGNFEKLSGKSEFINDKYLDVSLKKEQKSIGTQEKITEEVQEKPQDFDWDNLETEKNNYPEKERKSLEEMYQATLGSLVENEVVEGDIVTLTSKEAIIDIGSK